MLYGEERNPIKSYLQIAKAHKMTILVLFTKPHCSTIAL